jgi:hypothetical protein
VLESHESI